MEQKDFVLWKHVCRRVTWGRDAGEELADDNLFDMGKGDLRRALDKPRRLRAEFSYKQDGIVRADFKTRREYAQPS